MIYMVPSAFVISMSFWRWCNIDLHPNVAFDLGYLGDRTSKNYNMHNVRSITMMLIGVVVIMTRTIIADYT